MKYDQYFFRRQFILSPSKLQFFPDWKHCELPDGSFLKVHPDLQFSFVKKNQDFIVLLGFILDPYNPERNNEQIINDMIDRCKSQDDVFRYVLVAGGRYVILANLQDQRIMFSDPAGFRQVFYKKDSLKGIWVVSQPSILSHIFNLSVDQSIESDLYRIPLFARSVEYWYPGILTAFSGVNHLLPNHYLDLSQSIQKRYWPVERIENVSIEDCVESCAEILRGLYWSIQNRFDVAQAITAGLDSRLILAASRFVRSSIYYLTHTHKNLNVRGFDIVIPSKMLSSLGLGHNIVFHSEKIDPEFERIYRNNVTTARMGHGVNAFAIHRHFAEIGKEMVVVNGVCGEIVRNFYYLPGIVSINGKSLCALTRMRGSLLAMEQFESWLSASKGICKDSGVEVLDLFYWEQRVGNWASMSYSEYDMAFESFSPLNCRMQLQLMLGVKKKYRSSPGNLLQRELIKRLWPQTLDYPINPPLTLVSRVVRSLKRTPLHGILKAVKYWKE